MVQIALKIQLGCDGGANLNYEKFRQTNSMGKRMCDGNGKQVRTFTKIHIWYSATV